MATQQPSQRPNPPTQPSGLGWLQRWNFIARARFERQLWEAFERGEPIEQLAERCEPGFQKEVWEATARRIRRIEQRMRDQQPPIG